MEPGSWAEWVGSIATALTFGGGIFLWRSDIRGKKRLLANKFFAATALVGDDETGEVYFEVRVHNTGDTAIYMAYVSFFDIHNNYQTETVSELDLQLMENVVKPGVSKTTSIEFLIDPETYDPVLSFWDSNGAHWHRLIRGNYYLSEGQFAQRQISGKRFRSLRTWFSERRMRKIIAARSAARAKKKEIEG
ncbi:hypothetical protein [Rathayibacter sp. AY1F3]|uniref:hypothetical protein n=1 Tax=Rathayibacter sp. AY1F3 TaxID=2080558 RepID=UPI0011AFDEB7|nr:hypothetical protein [Rathayibacter sp. AY1F3]